MYRRFELEGDVHVALDCVPLSVRRKLDLAALKISLAGWQRLPRPERLALCHLPVDTDEELEVYRTSLRHFCERQGVELRPLDGELTHRAAWNAAAVPSALRERLAADAPERLAAVLGAWSGLGEEERYVLVKLADAKRSPEKLLAVLDELGLGRRDPG